MNKRPPKILQWTLLAPAILPLVYFNGILYPYVTLKTLLFRGFGVLALAVFAYLVLARYAFYWSRLRNKLTWIPGGLLFIAYTTSIAGLDFYHSFWSVFSRGDGLLTLSAVVVFFYLSLLCADREFFHKLLKTVTFVATLVSIHAIFQWIQLVSGVNIPFIGEPRGRIGGTFGNAAFLAGYLSMSVFLTLALAKGATRRLRNFCHFSAILQVLVVFLTATRGSILALFIVGLLVLIYNSVNKSNDNWRKYSRTVLVCVLVISGIFFSFRSKLSKSSFEPISRIASISFEDSTVSSRLFVWKEVLQEAMKKPFSGYGAENISVLFDRVYNPDRITEQWFDRSHNTFLDYFVQYGLFGLLFYLGAILTLIFTGFKMRGRGEVEGLYIVAMTVAYAVQGFFVFDTAMTLWVLFITMATILAISDTNDTRAQIPYFANSSMMGGILSFLIILLLIPISFKPLRANLLLADGYKYHISDVFKANKAMKEGLSLDTYADLEYGYQAYVMYTERQSRMLSGVELLEAYEYALKTLKDNFEKYTYDARTATYLAHVLDLAPPDAEIDEEFLTFVLDKAIELSPKRTQLWFIKANMFIRKGNILNKTEKTLAYKEAIAILEDFADRVPEDSESRYILATLYLGIDDKITANRLAEEGLALYRGNNIDTANRAMSYYINTEDWANAKLFLVDIIHKNPENYDLMYDLAKLHFLTGDIESSLDMVDRIKKEKPGLFETDQEFVKAIEGVE